MKKSRKNESTKAYLEYLVSLYTGKKDGTNNKKGNKQKTRRSVLVIYPR